MCCAGTCRARRKESRTTDGSAGGRPGSNTALKSLVESFGGEFVVHDGGIEDRKGLRLYVFTTFGREPAVEVSVPTSISRDQAPGAMAALTGAVKPLPQKQHCTDLDDVPSTS